MPLFDKLVYLAGDFEQYCESKERKISPNRLYIDALAAWCASPYKHTVANAWLAYIRKGHLIGDLLAEGIFQLDENGKLAEKWKGTGKSQDAFIRFRVRRSDGKPDQAWKDSELSESFIAYQNSLPAESDICYVLGQPMPVSAISPRFIRYPGDGAKLVSANDSSGFTYRGRFQTAEEAFVLGRETTEKAHAALKYLIRRQAYRNGDQVLLCFGTGGVAVPKPTDDTVAVACAENLMDDLPAPTLLSLKESIARQLRQAVAGYQNQLDRQAEVVVLGLDSATTGRLSIFYYRNLLAEDFFSRILTWHSTCTWRHTYRSVPAGTDDKGKPIYKHIVFVGAPAPADIIEAAYGDNVPEKLMKSGVERLLPCIVDGARLPHDLVASVARRATQRAALSAYESEKALSIACALIRKLHNDIRKEEVWTMALQEDVNDRSYLFGRAWAYAEAIERFALNEADEKRDTNAERMMAAFPRRPASSLRYLKERLAPYQSRLGPRASALNEGFYTVIARLETAGFTNDRLDDTYLLGYAAQKQAFYEKRNQRQAAKAENEEVVS